MKTRILAVAALAAAAMSMSACNTTGSVDLLKQMDANFANCDRHITFQGGVGVITPGAQVSGSVDCKGAAAPAAVPPGAQ